MGRHGSRRPSAARTADGDVEPVRNRSDQRQAMSHRRRPVREERWPFPSTRVRDHPQEVALSRVPSLPLGASDIRSVCDADLGAVQRRPRMLLTRLRPVAKLTNQDDFGVGHPLHALCLVTSCPSGVPSTTSVDTVHRTSSCGRSRVRRSVVCAAGRRCADVTRSGRQGKRGRQRVPTPPQAVPRAAARVVPRPLTRLPNSSSVIRFAAWSGLRGCGSP